MNKELTITDTIQARRSVRTYDTTPITEQDYASIRDYIENPDHTEGIWGSPVSLTLVPVTSGVTDKGIKLGTYGFIKNPQAYLIGMCKNTPENMVEYGYIFEKLVLFLTGRSIGTCWLGGAFTRNTFEQEINLRGDEVIPCITPIGYPSEKQRLFFDKTLRYMVKADRKKEWDELFFDSDFAHKLRREAAGWAETPIEMVRLGPSASNKQPWRIVLSADRRTAHFYLAHTKGYTREKAAYDIQQVDMGIAFCHFELACREEGLIGDWHRNDPKLAVPDSSTEYMASWSLM
jgi:nitroreductase